MACLAVNCLLLNLILMVFYHNASPVLCTSISPSLLVTCLCGEAIHSLPSQVSFEVFRAALLQDTGVPWEGDKEHCQSVGNSREVKGGGSPTREPFWTYFHSICMSCTWQCTPSLTQSHTEQAGQSRALSLQSGCWVGTRALWAGWLLPACEPAAGRDAFGATSEIQNTPK